MNDNIQKLYGALQKYGYNDLGTADEFGAKVQDENSRKKLYDALSRDGFNDLGTYEEFSGRLVQAPAQAAPAQAPAEVQTEQTVAAPAATQDKDASLRSQQAAEGRAMFDEMRMKKGLKTAAEQAAELPVATEQQEAVQNAPTSSIPEHLEQKRRDELVSLNAELEKYKETGDLVDEYERRLDSIKHSLDPQSEKTKEDTKWLQEHKEAYRTTKGSKDMKEYNRIKRRIYDLTVVPALDDVNEQADAINKEIWDLETGPMDSEKTARISELQDAKEIYQMAWQELSHGSKYDEGYEDGNSFKTAIKQFFGSTGRQVDRGTFTLGASEGAATQRARAVGDKYNNAINSAKENLGYSDEDVDALFKSLNDDGKALEDVVAELDSKKSALDAMEATYRDMEKNGASEEELDAYAKKYNEKIQEYNQTLSDRYQPLASKYEDERGNYDKLMSAVDESVATSLTDGEREILKAYESLINASAVAEEFASTASKAGASFENTLEFMVDFWLTKGLDKAGTKAATKIAKNRAVKKLGAEAVKNMTVRPGIGLNMAKDLGVSVARTAALPTRFAQSLGEQLTQVDNTPYNGKDALGRYQFSRSHENAWANTGVENFIEYWSEGFGEYFGAAEKALFKSTMGSAPKTLIGDTLKKYKGSVGRYLENTKFNGQLNETLEEVVGSGLNALFGFLSNDRLGDKGALEEFAKKENLLTLTVSFLPLSAISSATNLSAYHRMKSRYNEAVEGLNPFIESGAISRGQLDKLADNLSDMTPEQVEEQIVKIADQAREFNEGHLPSDFVKNIMGYLEGTYSMNLRSDDWEDSQEKLSVVNSYSTMYANPQPGFAWDADQQDAEARQSAIDAGFTEEELEQGSYILAQEAREMRDTEPERADALLDYANAKAAVEGLENGYRKQGEQIARANEEEIRSNLDVNGNVVTAVVTEYGAPKVAYITSDDVTIAPDGTVTTPTGNGVVKYRTYENGEYGPESTIMSDKVSEAQAVPTDQYIQMENDAILNGRNELYEQAKRTVSPTGQSRAISQRIGMNVVIRGNGAYQPVRVERMTDDGMKVVISGDKDTLKGVATAAQVQTPGGKYLEIDVTRLWPLLDKEADGVTLTTFEPEARTDAGAEQEQPQQAPAQAPQVNPDELEDSERTIMFNGRPTKVTVNSVGGDGVWFTYMDETGTEREGDMSLEDFMNSIVADEAPAAVEEAAEAPATAQGQAFPVDEKGNRIYDHPSVSPERAYRELMTGSVVGSKDEANRMKYIASKANKAAQAVADAENKIAGIQAKKDAVDEWEIGEDEELDAFENRKDAKKAEYDAEIAKVQDQMAELKRKAAHWAAVRDMAKAVAYMRKDARLVARAEAWTQRTGIKVKLCRTPEEVDDKSVKKALAKGERVGGWYNAKTGEVGLYLPNLANEAEVDKTFIHEVISHKGLKELLGKENYDALCDKVWDQLMSEAERQEFLAYNSHLKGDEQFLRRAAADEWIARFSEGLGLESNRNLFDKFVDFVKEFLDRILGEDAKISKDDIAMLLRSSLARYESERKADTRAQLYREGIASETQAAQLDDNAIRFNIKTEESVEQKIRDFAKSKEGRKLGWTDEQIESIIGETADLMRAIHAAVSGDKYYDEWAEKVPTIKVDWRDGEEKPTVTWSRANIEYKYDMSADLLCINNEGLETVLASPTMVELMLKMNQTTKEGFTSDDYLRLYETLRDMGFVVPCKGCFDAAMRLKMLPSVARKFVELVNKTIDERNADPEAFDRKVRSMAKPGSDTTVEGFPAATGNKADAIRVGVAGDRLTEHISWAQLMSAEGQTKALADWGGIFRAWQKTGAGRPKDKLLPEPWSGDIVNSTTTIIGKFGEKTPSYRDIEVNQGTGLRRNSHSEFRPLLAIDEIQFMREAFIRGLTVFKYMKELDDVRLFGKLGVKFNMSFFPAFVEGAPAAGLDANGNYIAAEESVGGREYEYVGEDGKTHYDGMKGWQEAQKYINKDVSLSSVIFSIPHLIKAFTDVPTKSNPVGMWGSLIPFHASGATAGSLKKQGLGDARALGVGHGFEEAMTDYDKGVTNFEAVQNDRFGEGWEILEGTKAGTKVTPGHKLEFANGTHYYNAGLGLHLFKSTYIFDSEIDEHPGEFVGVKAYAEKYGHPYSIDYNDKVREIGTDTAYQDASDYYVDMLRNLGLVPRFDFEVPEATFLQMCAAANIDPNHPKLGWKGEGHSWSPVDSEAYYSLWCDYGMIDPETGKLAPHNPVGIVDAEGNRTFQLPENAVDIIKDGVARYSERKDREAARELDAIEEFARRTVAEGKLKQEDADAILAEARSEQEAQDVSDDGSWTHFRKLEDPAKIEELENGEWEEDAYRAVQFVPDPNGEWEYDLGDGNGVKKGNVYPPMSAQTEKGEWRNPIQKGVIEESEEAPGKAFLKNGKWVFRLHKGNGKYVDAAYNPYIHSSDTMLNDQFSEAQSRGNLVVMRVAVPKSELDGENLYQAEKAKDHVGRHDWKAGPIQGELTGTRTVYLSRYDKPMELMPIEKVGESVAKMLEGQVETMPTNVVWPQLRAELEKLGMKFVETDNKGKLVSGENAGKTWKQVYGKKKPAKKKSTKKQKNSDTGTRFRKANESQLGLVSNAGAALDRIKMEKATPEQWVKMLEKEGGLKAGEDKWLGLSDWLKSQDKKTITKDEIDDYIAEHRIQIEEVRYGGSLQDDVKETLGRGRELSELQEEIDEIKESDDYQTIGDAWLRDEFLRDEMKERYGEDFEMGYSIYNGVIDYNVDEFSDMEYRENYSGPTRPINNVRLGYTTEGLDNKREIALTVPTVESWNENDDIHFGDAGEGRAVAWIRFGDTTTKPDSGTYSRSIMDELEKKYGNSRAYDKMSDEDVARAYFADYVYRGDRGVDYQDYKRMFMANDLGEERAEKVYPIFEQLVKDSAAGNRVLVIDEIQSKRHQEGREKGYKTDKPVWTYDPNVPIPERERYSARKVGANWFVYKDGEIEATIAANSEDEAIAKFVQTGAMYEHEIDKRIPTAPFEKNWHELAMKRMLRLAAEEGYDYVAWTTGDQQAERYNIGSKVEWIQRGNDFGQFPESVFIKMGDKVNSVEVDENGTIVDSTYALRESVGKPISDLLGKELSEQVMNATPGKEGRMDGEDLRVGGEGMKGFYDDILPRFMNKYGKKWGVKVSDITLPNVEEAGRTMHAVPVTQEMKESVMQGQTMFRKSVTPEQDKEYMDAVNSGDMEKAGQMVRDAFKDAFPNTKVVDENGEPKVMYHGTHYGVFNEFETGNEKYPVGAYFTENKAGATQYMKDRAEDAKYNDPDYDESISRVYEVFLNIERPLMFNTKGPMDESARGIYTHDIRELNDWDGAVRDLIAAGYDGAINNTDDEMTVAFFPNQIKSADPVTYDDNGNVIPLSERFNPENNDIRFRVSDEVDVPSVSANLYDAYENQNGEDKPWMSEQELIDRIEEELPYGIDTKELFSKIDEYRRLDEEDFDEGRRDFSGSERDAVFQEILSGLNGLAENGRAETSKEGLEKAERIAAAERIVTEKVLDSMPEAIGAGVQRVSRNDMPAGHKTDKGYYDPATNTVSVCMDNVLDERDAVATVIHETVGRKGLREIFGEQYRESMASSYAALDAEGRAWVNGYMLRNGLQPGDEGILRGMQEYMAVQVERGEGSFLDAVNDILSQAVDFSVGTEGFRFTNRELAYILRASFEHAKNPGWLDTPAGKAQDTLWKREYGINESDPNRPTDPEGPDAGTRFRRGDTGNALRDYERDMKDWRTAAVMENQNADLPVKIGYEKALKEKYGDQWSDRMKNLPENEDYLMRHNLSSSRAETESHNFMLFHFNPMLEKLREVQAKLVGRLSSADERQDAYERILDYLYAESGLERNDWERNNGGEAKDWSGLTSLMGRPKEEWQEAEDDARAMVAAFENELDDDRLINELWDAIRSCTDFSLDHAYRYGLLAKDEYERLRGTDTKPRMWRYYLPLRGFVKRTAEEEYNYAGLVSTDKGNNEVVKDAKGRWTEADNPLANILNIALKEIVQGNENYARQALYRFATNLGENSLLSVRKPWYVKDAATGKWSLAEPEEGQDIEAFEAEMKAKKERKEARQGRKGLDLGLIMASKGHRNQHLIHVKVGGEDRMIWVNGNPALSRAVSGIGKEPNYRLFRAGSRVISNLFTTYSIDFTAKNLLRDSIYSRVALLVKEDQHYRWTFMKNWWQNFGFGAFAFPMVRLAAMWDSGALQRKPADKRTKREQMFIDFMTDGGQTGYTVIKSVEKIKSDIERTMRRAGKKTGPVVVPILGWYGLGVRTLNEAFELLTRFTAYQTSRDEGRTGQRAAYDAKEISVNFNRKGAQSNEGFWGQVAAYFGGTHYFYNAGIQGFDNFLRLFTKPRKGKGWIMPVTSAGIMTLGFFTPMINALLSGGGDDDDDNREAEWYWNLPEWVRRNNIVIGFKNKYLAVPLPVEFRALYGLGDLTASVFAANKYAHPTPGRVMLDAVALASSVLPVNPIEGVNGSIASASELAESAVRTAVPDLTMFFVDWVTNKDYTGRALVNKSPYNPAMPASQGAFASTPKALVEACQWIGEKTGVDVAPGLVRDFLNNYGGGYYRFAEDLSKQIFTDDTHPRRWDDVPFLSGFTGHIDEDRTITYSNTVLNTYKDLSTNVVKKMNLYSNSADITEKIAFEDPEALPAKAKVQAILSGKDYELAKMYYFGMKDEDTGQTEKVVKVHQKGKSAGKQYKATVHIKIPGVSTLKKRWRDAKDAWASMPDGTAEEKAAKAQAYADMTNAWHEYYNAAADLADKLMDYDYGKTE